MNSEFCGKNCLWTKTIEFCQVLKKHGVPLDNMWPSLILQMRNVSDDPSLSPNQKIGI